MGPPLQIQSRSIGSGPGPPLQGQKLRFGRGPPLQGQQPRFGPGPPLQGQQPRFGQGPSLQGDFVRRVVPRPAPTRGRGTSMYRSDEIPLQRRPSQSWCSSLRRACRAGIDEATDTHLAKDAMVRGSGASRPWMACARLLAPWTAQSGDAHDPRTAAAPPEAENSSALRPHCHGSTRSHATPAHFNMAGSGISRLGEKPRKNPNRCRLGFCRLVEVGGVEPPSEGTPSPVLHA